MISASRLSESLTATPGSPRNEAARQAANRGPAPRRPHCQTSILIEWIGRSWSAANAAPTTSAAKLGAAAWLGYAAAPTGIPHSWIASISDPGKCQRQADIFALDIRTPVQILNQVAHNESAIASAMSK